LCIRRLVFGKFLFDERRELLKHLGRCKAVDGSDQLLAPGQVAPVHGVENDLTAGIDADRSNDASHVHLGSWPRNGRTHGGLETQAPQACHVRVGASPQVAVELENQVPKLPSAAYRTKGNALAQRKLGRAQENDVVAAHGERALPLERAAIDRGEPQASQVETPRSVPRSFSPELRKDVRRISHRQEPSVTRRPLRSLVLNACPEGFVPAPRPKVRAETDDNGLVRDRKKALVDA
jgi:hypothetical protein